MRLLYSCASGRIPCLQYKHNQHVTCDQDSRHMLDFCLCLSALFIRVAQDIMTLNCNACDQCRSCATCSGQMDVHVNVCLDTHPETRSRELDATSNQYTRYTQNPGCYIIDTLHLQRLGAGCLIMYWCIHHLCISVYISRAVSRSTSA